MTVYNFITNAGQTITGFDVDVDVLSIDSTVLGSAAGATFNITGDDLVLTVGGLTVTLAGVSIREITTDNVNFTDNSELRIGDNTTNAFDDDTANTVDITANTDNRIWGFGGADSITITGDGDNYVHGNEGADTALDVNGDGNNTVLGGAGDDAAIDIDGNGDNLVYGGLGADDVDVTGDGNNTVFGANGAAGASDGNDNLSVTAAASGNNTLNGQVGDDTIAIAGTGANVARGGAGTDNITVSAASGTATVYGGGDTDTVTVTGAAVDTTIWGGSGAAGDTDGVDTIDVQATALGNNFVNGQAGADLITLTVGSGGGNNTIKGGAGGDTFTYGDANADLAEATGNNTISGGDGDDTFNVVFTGTTANTTSTLEGGEGADTFDIELDDAAHSIKFSDFNADEDVINLDLEGESAINITVSRAAGSTQLVGTQGTFEAILLQNFTGNFNSTNLVLADGTVIQTNFDGAASTLTGSTGADQIVTGDNGDTVTGTAGADKITGGTGADVFKYTGTLATTLSTLTTLAGGSGNDTLEIITDATTMADADFATLNSIEIIDVNANVTGNSITLDTNALAAGIRTVDLAGITTATHSTTVDASSLGAAMTVVGSAGIDTVSVDAGSNNVSLGGAADVLNLFGAAAGTLQGGDGVDTLDIANVAAHTTTFNGTGIGGFEVIEADTTTGDNTFTFTSAYNATVTAISGKDIDISVEAGANDIVVNGSALTLDASITGAAGGDTIVAGSGADTLTGAAGADSLTGGTGVDNFVFASTAVGNGVDVISDFTLADDNLIFTAFDASATTLDGTFADTSTAEAVPADGNVYLVTDADASIDTAGEVAALFTVGAGDTPFGVGIANMDVVVLIQGTTDTTIWYVDNDGTGTVIAGECVQIATLEDYVGGFTAANFA